MKVLGVACPFWHDPSAALVIDGEVVAAVEQERFSRRKHAVRELPVEAVQYCLAEAGLTPQDIDRVAFPWSHRALEANRRAFVRRYFGRRPIKAIKNALRAGRKGERRIGKLHQTLEAIGLGRGAVPIDFIEHHVAHAASALHASGFDRCAIASLDGLGEITTCLFAEGRGGQVHKLGEIQKPDSLGLFYGSLTEFLGFEINDGEYKTMGMAAYGDASRVDLSDILRYGEGDLSLDLDFLWSPKDRRHTPRHSYGRRFVERFGPPREGDVLAEPYIHLAAAGQDLLERAAISLIEHHLEPALRETGRLCLAGGVALNVVLNRKLMQHPWIEELYVPPSPGDAGTAVGAATAAAQAAGDAIQPLRSAYLGPSYDSASIQRLLDERRIPYQKLADPAASAAELLAGGEVVAWFQGRMEWGPRALGNRSILGNPCVKGTAEDINTRIKYREPWRPFCPSVLEERATEFLGSKHASPYMTLSFDLPEESRQRCPEITHVDGTARPQIVSKTTNPRFHHLISELEARTGVPCVINTSLNRRGEPMVNSPEDALRMFFESGLENLVMEDLYVSKRPTGTA